MIYFSEKPLTVWQPNLIMLDLEDGLGHIYVTRNTYDQAVLLDDRFNHDVSIVNDKLKVHPTQTDAMDYMSAVLPKPLNILAPFFNLLDVDVKLDLDNVKQLIGVLSYMSQAINFNVILKVPVEVRANLVFTKSILLDWQSHYEDFTFKFASSLRHIEREDGPVVGAAHEPSNTVSNDTTTVEHDTSTAMEEDPNEVIDNMSDEEIAALLGLDDEGFKESLAKDREVSQKPEPSAASTANSSRGVGSSFIQDRSDADAYAEIVARFC